MFKLISDAEIRKVAGNTHLHDPVEAMENLALVDAGARAQLASCEKEAKLQFNPDYLDFQKGVEATKELYKGWKSPQEVEQIKREARKEVAEYALRQIDAVQVATVLIEIAETGIIPDGKPRRRSGA